ncbi:homologous recombination OB-fold protein [Dugong dugon]
MELEGSGTELKLGVSSEATGVLLTCQGEDPVLAKKARVAELSGSCPKGSTLATHNRHDGLISVQCQLLDPVVHGRTPQCHLRPGTSGNLPIPTASTVPTQQSHWRVCAKGSPLQAHQPLQTAGSSVQCSPQNNLFHQPLQSPGACLSGKPRFFGPRTPNSGFSTPSRARYGFCPRGLSGPQSPVASVESPAGTPKSPHSSMVPQAALQMPIVTNHLVQLVTAANRTPQLPLHTTTQAKARRFPGPAGLLPHQHSGKNLEEIMVSTPQTPTHGALAKFRMEIVASSQASVEEDFGRGPWLTMKSSLGLDERDPTCFLCTYSIVMVLRKAALKQLPRNKVPNMAVMIKSLTRSTVDASVVFKDPTGEMQGTVHRVLLEMRQNELKPGSVLLLKQIGVFSPSLRNHYLNVTPNNLVRIYSPDSGDGNFLKPSQPFPKDLGSFHGSLQRDVDPKSKEDLRTAQDPEVGASPEEEHLETDDLDGLLSELPEDFFSGTSSWDYPKAGHPP